MLLRENRAVSRTANTEKKVWERSLFDCQRQTGDVGQDVVHVLMGSIDVCVRMDRV